jgi:two-component system OmpR family response regulator
MSEARRILVVDDQADIRELTSTVLSAAGYDVVAVGSGTGALDHLAGAPFDLVLLDVNMPEMDGWETLRLIRADEELLDVAVVRFTGKGELHDQIHGMQEGAMGYITKPFMIDELLARLDRVFATLDHGGSPPPLSPRTA